MAHLHSQLSASITEFKRNPMATLSQAEGEPIVILNHNEPAFYCVPPALYSAMVEALEDAELNALADARAGLTPVEVSLDAL